MSTRLRNHTEAVVLSGGGAKGAYEVGVMKALFNGASEGTGFTTLDAEVFTGTSVGAYNATFMASRSRKSSASTLEELEGIWRTLIANTLGGCGNGIIRMRGLPFQGLDLGCLRTPVEELVELTRDTMFFANFALIRARNLVESSAPLRTRVAESIDLSALFSVAPFDNLVKKTIDLDELRTSAKKLTIAASNWKEGTLQLFTKKDITDGLGPGAILASAAIPGIFPPVELNGTPYVDGGVLNNTPLRPAVKDGADVLHVVYLDPLVEKIPFPQLPNTLNTVYRMYAILQSANMKNDINTARSVNRGLEIERGRQIEGEPNSSSKFSGLRFAAEAANRRRQGRPYRRLTIHRYRPVNDLGGGEGLLDFSARNIDSLIDLGFRDAVNHNCVSSKCDLAAESERSPVASVHRGRAG